MCLLLIKLDLVHSGSITDKMQNYYTIMFFFKAQQYFSTASIAPHIQTPFLEHSRNIT